MNEAIKHTDGLDVPTETVKRELMQKAVKDAFDKREALDKANASQPEEIT